MVKHSKEYALSRHEFESFVEGCRQIDDEVQKQEALFIAFTAGRLGMRAGEILHMDKSWVDWRNRMIDIPSQDTCTKNEGQPCGYCKRSAKEKAERSKMTLAEARLEVIQNKLLGQLESIPGHVRKQLSTAHIVSINGDLDVSSIDSQINSILDGCETVKDREDFKDSLNSMAKQYREENIKGEEDMLEKQWKPKTKNASRSIPFDWCPRAEIQLEKFFTLYDEFPYSQSAIQRRVNKSLELSVVVDKEDCSPHGLRATAATELAARGIPAPTLQQLFGWSQISTAQNYVSSSPERSQKQLYR